MVDSFLSFGVETNMKFESADVIVWEYSMHLDINFHRMIVLIIRMEI